MSVSLGKGSYRLYGLRAPCILIGVIDVIDDAADPTLPVNQDTADPTLLSIDDDADPTFLSIEDGEE